MSAARGCPHPEEFSALLDRALSPERIPTLERHVESCATCRRLFLRLSAASRMLGLVLGRVHLAQECMGVKPEAEDAPSAALVERLEAFGLAQRGEILEAQQAARRKSRSRKILIGLLAAALVVVGALGSLQLTTVSELSGGARQRGGYVVGPGEVGLCRGSRVRLSEDAKARFWCAFRWQQPSVELLAGRLDVLEGRLLVKVGEGFEELSGQGVAKVNIDGKVTVEKPE